MEKGRLKYTIRNMSWQFIYQVLTLTLGVILPRYIIKVYGSDVNGLTSTIKHVLTLVTIIQAGLGTSATYLMYKPLEENDKIKISCLLDSIKKIYKLISLGVAILGLVVSVSLGFLVKGEIAGKYIFIASFITCIDSSLSLYFTSACNVFLNAKQDKYLISIVSLITGTLNYVFQIIILLIKPTFLFLYFNNMLICILNIIILVFVFRKQFKPYKLTEEEKKEVHTVPIPGVSYAALNEASHAAVYGMITIVVSIMGNLKDASVLSVYLMVINLLSTISNVAYTSFVPSYGSMVAEGNQEKINKVFEIFQFSFFTLTTFLFMCTSYLMIPFVKLYTNEVVDTNYINELLMLLCIFYGLFYAYRIPYNNTVSVTGLFKETYLQPLLCAIIAIVLMFILTPINFALVMVGPVLFYAINTLYQHFKLKKIFVGFENNHFWKHFIVSLIGVLLAIITYYLWPPVINSFGKWLLYSFACAILYGLILLLIVILIDRKSFKLTYNYFIHKFFGKKEKKEI